MNFKKLFLRLKNGKTVTFYGPERDECFTVELTYKNDMFTVYSYIFEGEEDSEDLGLVQLLKDELTKNFCSFNEVISDLESRFPWINLNI